MPLLASALQRAKKRKAEAAAAKEAAAAAAAAVTAASGDAASCSPSSASSPSTASDAATAVAASGSSSRESAAAASKAGAKSAAVAVVASSSSSAYAPPALPPLPPPPLSLRGSTLSSFDLGAVLGESPPPCALPFFFPQSFLAPPPLLFHLISFPCTKGSENKKKNKKQKKGTGSFGKVQLARHRATGQVCALKSLSKSHLLRSGQVAHLLSEKEVLGSLRGEPAFVRLLATFQVSFGRLVGWWLHKKE